MPCSISAGGIMICLWRHRGPVLGSDNSIATAPSVRKPINSQQVALSHQPRGDEQNQGRHLRTSASHLRPRIRARHCRPSQTGFQTWDLRATIHPQQRRNQKEARGFLLLNFVRTRRRVR